MGVKVTGQFEPAGDFSIVDGKDVSGNITGSNISSSGELEAASIGTNLSSIISGSTPFDAAAVSGSLGSNATLIRSLTAVGISGSVTSVSSSLASRITTEEGNVDTLQARNLIAGDGLTGGGTLAADRTFNIGAGTGITVNANDIAVSAAQTSITSIINNSLGKIGTNDDHPTAAYITFGTSNEINTFINNSERLSVRNGGIDVTGVITSTGNISGSATSTGSFGRLESNTFNTTTFNSTEVTSTNLTVTGTITGSSLDVSGNGNFGGNVVVEGDITAQNYIVSSSVTNITTQELSGSTIFGDSSDDTHVFTGSLSINSGGINVEKSSDFLRTNTNWARNHITLSRPSGSDNIVVGQLATAVNGAYTAAKGYRYYITNRANGTSYATQHLAILESGDIEIWNRNSQQNDNINGNARLYVVGSNDSAGTYGFRVANSSETDIFAVENDSNVTITGNLTTSGNISGSSTSTGSFGAGYIDNKLGIGVSAPATQLDVDGTSRFQVDTSASYPVLKLLDNGDAARGHITVGSQTIAIYPQSSKPKGIVITRASSNTNSNRVGVGFNSSTTDLPSKLTISGSVEESLFKVYNHQNTSVFEITGSNISGSSTSTGSFGSLVVADAIQGNTTLEGGVLFFDNNKGPRTTSENLTLTTTRYVNLNDHGSGNMFQADGTHEIIYLGTSGKNMTTRVYGNLRLDYGDFDITGSSTSTGSFGRVVSAGGVFEGAGSKKLIIESDSNISLSNNDLGTSNTLFGFQAGNNLIAGSNQNTAIGQQTLVYAGSADTDGNTAVGYRAMLGSSAGSVSDKNPRWNTAIGYQSLQGITTGDNNVALGYQSGIAVSTGPRNTIIGNGAGGTITAGENNILIGSGADVDAAAGSNRIGIGYNVSVDADHKTVIGASTQTVVEFGGDALISGSSASTGSFGQLQIQPDTDSGFAKIGRTFIGTTHSDHAGFSHVDQALSSGGYALVQSSGGITALNAASGQKINFNINNSNIAIINEHGLGINVTPIDDVRLYVKASDNDDGIRLDDASGNQLFKVFQQSTNVGRMFLKGGGATVFNVTSGADASFINVGTFGVGVTSPTAELDVSGSLQVSGHISGSSTSTGSFGAGYIDNKLGIGISAPTHKLHALSTDNKAFLLDRNTGNNPTNLNEFSLYYSLSIKNRASGTYLNFGGDSTHTSLQATDGAGSATAKNLLLNPYGGNVGIATAGVAPSEKLSMSGNIFLTDTSPAIYFKDKGVGDSFEIKRDGHTAKLTEYSSGVKSSEIHLQGRASGDGASRGGILFRTATHQHSTNGPQDAVYINLSGSVELMRDGANLSGSSTSTGSFGSLVVSDKVQGDLHIRDQVGIGRSPSSDYALQIQQPTGTNNNYIQGIQDNGSNTAFRIDTDSNDNVSLRLYHGSGGQIIHLNGGGTSTFSGTGGLEVIGKISGSATTTGSFGRLEAGTISSSRYIGQIGSRYVHSQTVGSSTWAINHNIGHKYPVVTVYDDDDRMILPEQGTATDSNTFTLTFNEAITGKAVVSVGGIGENAGANFIHTQDGTSTNWRVTHSLSQQYPNITVFDENNEVILPETITATSANETDIVFSSPQSGYANFSIGSGIPNISEANAGKYLKVRSDGTGVEWVPSTSNLTGSLSISGSIIPNAHNHHDLGSDAIRWRNIYSADLQLSNEGTQGNEVDGTTGNWTIQEGEDDLYLLNRKNGKKYKFKLEEIT